MRSVVTLINNAEQASPEWLTQVLHASKALKTGSVKRIDKATNTSYHSQTTRLQITFADLATGKPPQQLFLKILTKNKGKREIEAYQQLMSLSRYPSMITPCIAAKYDGNTGLSNLLLVDVSSTGKGLKPSQA